MFVYWENVEGVKAAGARGPLSSPCCPRGQSAPHFPFKTSGPLHLCLLHWQTPCPSGFRQESLPGSSLGPGWAKNLLGAQGDLPGTVPGLSVFLFSLCLAHSRHSIICSIAGQAAWPLSIYLGRRAGEHTLQNPLAQAANSGAARQGHRHSLRLDAEDLSNQAPGPAHNGCVQYISPPPPPQRVSKARRCWEGRQVTQTPGEIQLLFIDMESRYPQLPEDEVSRWLPAHTFPGSSFRVTVRLKTSWRAEGEE